MTTEVKKKHSNIELIRGDPKKAINKLSVPMMASMLLIMAYNIADSVWVAGLGAEALAAIGFITPLFLIVIGLGNGIGSGANSLMARAIGAKNKALVNNAALHAIVITLIISIVAPLILVPLLPQIITLMGGGETLEYALAYGNITFGLMIVFLFSSVASAILRAEGDVNRATIAMAITAILNIVLDPIFIYYLGMGIAGAGWATIISATISCIVMIYWMWVKKDTYVDLHFSQFKPSKAVLFDILKVSIPSTAEQFIMSLLAMVINAMLVMVATTDAVAVYTAGMRLIQIAMIPLMGLGTALLTVGGAAYGARNYKKLNISLNYTVKTGFIISIIMAIIFAIFAPQIALLFSYSASTAYLTPQIATLIRLFTLFLIFMPFGMSAACLFQGAGRGVNSLAITLLRSLICESIFAYLFGFIFGMGEVGIYCGVIVGGFCGSMFGYAWSRIFLNKTKKLFEHHNAEKTVES